MGRFYGGGAVFPGLPVGAPATVPIIRQGAVVPPEALPVGGAIPSGPAGFAPYEIRPPLVGSVPQKQIVPPLWGEGTAASMIAKGIFAQRVDPNGLVPTGASPVRPPSPVVPFFTTSASNAAARANTADLLASIAGSRAAQLQRKANEAAHHASKTAASAAVDPHPTTQGAAKAASEHASNTQQAADLAAQQAAEHDRRAARAAADAQAAADREAAAAADRAAANANSIAQGDDKALLDGGRTDFIWPDGQMPLIGPSDNKALLTLTGAAVSSSVIGYVAPVGGGAVAGFLLGGPVGALLGALLGGGYTYVKHR